MRAERIQPMLDLLEAVWREHPDWRLGQLVCNVAIAAEPPAASVGGGFTDEEAKQLQNASRALAADAGMLVLDPFHVEDRTLAAGLLAMTSERRRIGGELARALGIDPATLPKASAFPRPTFGCPIDETGENT